MTALTWITVALVCFALEIASSGFWFMWLGLAALFTALLVFVGLTTALSMQFCFFAFCSLILVIFTRPLLLKFVKVKDTHSNTDALIGKQGIMTVSVSPLQFGQAKINGEIWTVAADSEIAAGSSVEVIAVKGVKLYVKPIVSTPDSVNSTNSTI